MFINNRLIKRFVIAGSLASTVPLVVPPDLYGHSVPSNSFDNSICLKGMGVGCSLIPGSARDSVDEDNLLMEIKPNPKYIVSRRNHKSGVTELKLENGVIVLLYPFKSPDSRISIRGSLLGGLNEYSSAKDRISLMALVNIGGSRVLKGRSPEDIARIQNDRFADIVKEISQYQRSVTFETRSKDFRYALELYWTGLFDFEVDTAKYKTYLDWVEKGRPKAVDQAFQDSMRLYMYGNSPRIVEELSSGTGELESEYFIEVFSKAYWGYGGSVYVIAGDIDTETINRNIEMYLANLPGTVTEIPLIHDSTLRVVKGVVRKDFKIKGQSGTRSTLYFHGDMTPTLNDYENLNIGATLLADQIKNRLGSAADSISVVPVWGVGPVPSFVMQVSFVSRDYASAKRNDDSVVSIIKQFTSASASNSTSDFEQPFKDAQEKYLHMFKDSSSSSTVWWGQRLSLFNWFGWPYNSAKDEQVIVNAKVSDVMQILARTMDLSNYGHFHLSGPVATGGNK